MVEGLVTVVVPIYNVEKYLDRCVSSIVNQSYRNLEIILVDDGSLDSCPEMCDQWAMRDNRIKVVHKENAGLGMARNTGINCATGEYICFFDSDDYIEPDTIEVCMQRARKESADIIAFGNDKVTQKGKVCAKRVPNPPKTVFLGEEIVQMLLPKALYYDTDTGENWNLLLSAWTAIYAMKTIQRNDWRFVSEREIISEDFYSLLSLYAAADKVVIINNVYYHYVMNPVSLTHTYRADRYYKLKIFYHEMLKLSEDISIHSYVHKEIAAVFVGLSIGCFKQIVASKDSFTEKINKIREIIEDFCLQDILKNNSFNGDPKGKKILWWAVRRKKVLLCYFIVKMRNVKDKVRK